MNEKPKLKLSLTSSDKLLNVISKVLLIFLWIAAIFFYFNLPDIIPTHFNFRGKPDRFGNKLTIFILAILGTIFYFGLSALIRRPHFFNYPVKITKENAAQQYGNATTTIRYLKSVCLAIFICINIMSYLTATSKTTGIGIVFLPISLFMVLAPVIYSIIRSFKIEKRQ